MHRVIRLFTILITSIAVVACSQHQTAPISSRQAPVVTQTDTHTVRAGETLYSIAWQYNLDYRYLARLNGINRSYLIYPGQKIILKPTKGAVQASRSYTPSNTPVAPAKPSKQPSRAKPAVGKKTPPTVTARSDKTPSSITRPAPKSNTFSPPEWRWPVGGEVLTNFSGTGGSAKGIDITGKKGESVLAAAAGKVVYAGSGIRGYGNLVIIRHNTQYLSAYAHNRIIDVKEGEKVAAGQRIAEIGSTGIGAKNRTLLHFQVRKDGNPIDPITVLPKRNF